MMAQQGNDKSHIRHCEHDEWRPNGNGGEYDIEQIKRYRALPVKEKLRLLEEYRAFIARFMPPRSKRAWEILRKRGW